MKRKKRQFVQGVKVKGGMIWHITVHPDYYRQGIGEKLLKKAEKQAVNLGLNRFEAVLFFHGLEIKELQET